MKLQSKKCTLRGLGYHLHVAGDENAPCIILLHGLLDTGASFAPLIRALSTQIMARHWIAPDWRGHGNTDRAPEGYWFPDYLADLDALLQAVAPNQAVALVGHSMGGQVASMYAGAQPDAVSHLITLDSLNVPDAPIERTPERYRQWLAGLRKPLRERSFASITAIAARIARRYPELTSATCRWLAANWARKTADGRFCLAFDPRHRLPFPYGFRLAEAKALWREVRAPTLCLDAEQSRLQQGLDAADMRARQACFAHLTQETIVGCGHMLHVQAPDVVARSIARFLTAPATTGTVTPDSGTCARHDGYGHT